MGPAGDPGPVKPPAILVDAAAESEMTAEELVARLEGSVTEKVLVAFGTTVVTADAETAGNALLEAVPPVVRPTAAVLLGDMAIDTVLNADEQEAPDPLPKNERLLPDADR